MLIKKLLVITLSCLLLFTPLRVEGATFTEPDISEYKEYDSFLKRYGEHASELMYYYSVAYGSNEHYFKENVQMFDDAIKSAFGDNAITQALTYGSETSANLLAKPVAFLAATLDTGGNIASKIFGKIKSFFGSEEYPDYPTASNYLYAPDGYYFKVEGLPHKIISIYFTRLDSSIPVYIQGKTNQNALINLFYASYSQADTQRKRDLIDSYVNRHPWFYTASEFFEVWGLFDNRTIRLARLTDDSERPVSNTVYPAGLPQVIDNVVNNINNYPQDYTPTVQPQLVCPQYVVELNFENGNFKTTRGQAITFNENETIMFNNESCFLDFKFPEIQYDDEKKQLIVDGKDLSPVTTEPDGFDGGILAYIRNSYNYATSAVSTAVYGLESIGGSVIALGTFVGSVFVFLPPEMTTFIMSGFALALGLWVIKK